MKAVGTKESIMDKVPTLLQVVLSTQATGSVESTMVLERLSGLMAPSTKENGRTAAKKATESL